MTSLCATLANIYLCKILDSLRVIIRRHRLRVLWNESGAGLGHIERGGRGTRRPWFSVWVQSGLVCFQREWVASRPLQLHLQVYARLLSLPLSVWLSSAADATAHPTATAINVWNPFVLRPFYYYNIIHWPKCTLAHKSSTYIPYCEFAVCCNGAQFPLYRLENSIS